MNTKREEKMEAKMVNGINNPQMDTELENKLNSVKNTIESMVLALDVKYCYKEDMKNKNQNRRNAEFLKDIASLQAELKDCESLLKNYNKVEV